MIDDDASKTPESTVSLSNMLDMSVSSLCVYIGFGFLLAWIFMGLYVGFPIFLDGDVDALTISVLFIFFALVTFGISMVDVLRRLLMSKSMFVIGGIAAAVGSFMLVLTGLEFVEFSDGAISAIQAIGAACMGAGTAIILLHYGLFFSRMRPRSALLAFCVSFIGTFFGYFFVESCDFPASSCIFSLFPVVSTVTFLPTLMSRTHDVKKCFEGESQYSRGYVRLVVMFCVFCFVLSIAQAFRPPQDFALSFDLAIVVSLLVLLGIVILVLVPQLKIRTFSVLKVIYLTAVILLIFRLIVQPLFIDNWFFAIVNVVQYILLFMVFWLLIAFVGSVGELDPLKAFGIPLACAVIFLALGWVIGKEIYAFLGHDRYYFNIAMGCVLAFCCTFGFSLNDFSKLTIGGYGARKANNTVASAINSESAFSIEEVVDYLAEKYGLTNREKEVTYYIAQGENAESIASELVVSYYTIRTHIRNIYSKLGVKSRSEFFHLFFETTQDITKE